MEQPGVEVAAAFAEVALATNPLGVRVGLGVRVDVRVGAEVEVRVGVRVLVCVGEGVSVMRSVRDSSQLRSNFNLTA